MQNKLFNKFLWRSSLHESSVPKSLVLLLNTMSTKRVPPEELLPNSPFPVASRRAKVKMTLASSRD